MATRNFHTAPPDHRADVDLCIVGNLTIDVILRGIAEMPRWGEEVLCDARSEAVAGQAGGMALASVRMGMTTEVVADVGDDASGERIRRELGAASVGVDSVHIVKGATTPLTVALVRPDGERAFLADLGTLGILDVGAVDQRPFGTFAASVVALVGTSDLPGVDYGSTAAMLERVQRAGALTVFDPGWDPDGWGPETVTGIRKVLAYTDVFLPNLDEARAISGEGEISRILGAFATVCPGITVVKGGAAGSYLIVEGEVVVVEALPTEVDNAVGAGDVFNAGVVAGFLRGEDVLASMALGTGAASLYVSRRRNRFPTYEESAELAQRVTTMTF